MKRQVATIVGCIIFGACTPAPAPSAPRFRVQRTGGALFELIPAEAQLPYCLAYSVSASGVTRQLTMSKQNVSPECPAGRPIGGHVYRAPLNEGPVVVHVFFTSQPVNAASLTQQILDAENRQKLSVMNMRIPGNATLETVEFVPAEEPTPEVGALVERDGGQP